MIAAWTKRLWFACLSFSCLLIGERAFAQTPAQPELEEATGRWTLVNALGYGGVGFLTGVAAAWDSETLGASAAVPLINGEGEGTPLGSDESSLAMLMGGGTLLGVWYLRRHSGELDGARLGITPIRTRDSAYGLRVSVRY